MNKRIFFTIKDDIGVGIISFWKEDESIRLSYGIQNSSECFSKKMVIICEMCKEVINHYETDKVWNILKQKMPKKLSSSEFVSYLMSRL